jgi:hypothetical protein
MFIKLSFAFSTSRKCNDDGLVKQMHLICFALYRITFIIMLYIPFSLVGCIRIEAKPKARLYWGALWGVVARCGGTRDTVVQ